MLAGGSTVVWYTLLSAWSTHGLRLKPSLHSRILAETPAPSSPSASSFLPTNSSRWLYRPQRRHTLSLWPAGLRFATSSPLPSHHSGQSLTHLGGFNESSQVREYPLHLTSLGAGTHYSWWKVRTPKPERCGHFFTDGQSARTLDLNPDHATPG